MLAFARIRDITIHHRYVPAARRPTLVFANSLGTDFRIWDAAIEQLGGEFGYLVYDKRGHGLSELGEAAETIETHAADLAGLMDHLGIEHGVICGLSIGGIIAQCLYGARPELIDGLILCDTASKIGTAEMWNGRIDLARSSGIAGIADGAMEKWFTPAFHTNRSAELAGYKAMLIRQLPAGYAAACAAIRDADFSAMARTIKVPTLVVVGDQDGSTPPDLVEGLARSIPGARFEIITGAAHIPCVEQPLVVAGLIREFMAGDMSRSAV